MCPRACSNKLFRYSWPTADGLSPNVEIPGRVFLVHSFLVISWGRLLSALELAASSWAVLLSGHLYMWTRVPDEPASRITPYCAEVIRERLRTVIGRTGHLHLPINVC